MVAEPLNATEEGPREIVACSKFDISEADASEATRGNTDSHNISDNIIEIESTSTSNSSETINNIPLSRVYANLHKDLVPSPSTKHKKKPENDEFVPMNPNVLERIVDMAQMRIDVCQRLPVDHPLQPPMI